jgi:hypothetical protein
MGTHLGVFYPAKTNETFEKAFLPIAKSIEAALFGDSTQLKPLTQQSSIISTLFEKFVQSNGSNIQVYWVENHSTLVEIIQEDIPRAVGSLVKKNILFYGDFIHDHNAESYYWTVPVSEERQVNSVGATYKPINSVKELLVKITDELYNPVNNAKQLFSKINNN